jgi:hypothetical protein
MAIIEDFVPVLRGFAVVVPEEAAKRNCKLPLVDNYPVWKKIQDEEPERFQKMVSDGIHPHSGPSMEITWKAVEALLEKAREAALKGGAS